MGKAVDMKEKCTCIIASLFGFGILWSKFICVDAKTIVSEFGLKCLNLISLDGGRYFQICNLCVKLTVYFIF